MARPTKFYKLMRKTSRYMIPNMGYITEYNGRYYHLASHGVVDFWVEYVHEALSTKSVAAGLYKVDESDCREGEWFEPTNDVPEKIKNCLNYLDRDGNIKQFE